MGVPSFVLRLVRHSGYLFDLERRRGSSPLISLQRLLDSTKSSHPSTAHDHFARKPGVASQLCRSYGSPQTISPLRPAVISSSSRPAVRGGVHMVLGSETVMVRGVPRRFRVGVALMSSPMRSCSSSQWSKHPSRLIRLSRSVGGFAGGGSGQGREEYWGSEGRLLCRHGKDR
jgi:hypothetical protein